MGFDEQNKPLEYAMRLLSARDYSEKNLREKIRNKFSAEDEDGVIEKLKGYGYIDDKRYAAMYTASKLRSGYGFYYIKYKLFEKGIEIDEDFMDYVIRDRDIDIAYYASEILCKYVAKRKKDETWQKKRKAFAYLMNRGYDRNLIDKLIREYFENESDFS